MFSSMSSLYRHNLDDSKNQSLLYQYSLQQFFQKGKYNDFSVKTCVDFLKNQTFTKDEFLDYFTDNNQSNFIKDSKLIFILLRFIARDTRFSLHAFHSQWDTDLLKVFESFSMLFYKDDLYVLNALKILKHHHGLHEFLEVASLIKKYDYYPMFSKELHQNHHLVCRYEYIRQLLESEPTLFYAQLPESVRVVPLYNFLKQFPNLSSQLNPNYNFFFNVFNVFDCCKDNAD